MAQERRDLREFRSGVAFDMVLHSLRRSADVRVSLLLRHAFGFLPFHSHLPRLVLKTIEAKLSADIPAMRAELTISKDGGSPQNYVLSAAKLSLLLAALQSFQS